MSHYICDPHLNTECPKTNCNYNHPAGPCFATSNPNYTTNVFIDLDIPGMYEVFEKKILNKNVQ